MDALSRRFQGRRAGRRWWSPCRWFRRRGSPVVADPAAGRAAPASASIRSSPRSISLGCSVSSRARMASVRDKEGLDPDRRRARRPAWSAGAVGTWTLLRVRRLRRRGDQVVVSLGPPSSGRASAPAGPGAPMSGPPASRSWSGSRRANRWWSAGCVGAPPCPPCRAHKGTRSAGSPLAAFHGWSARSRAARQSRSAPRVRRGARLPASRRRR